MRIMLSSLEGGAQKVACKNNMTRFRAIQNGISGTPLLWNLMSYYYLRTDVEFAVTVRDMSDLVMIDSGAHSFQKGAKVKWDEYTHAYAAFIREFDRPNVVGYFEMDVDNVIGYPKVLELRSILERESGHSEKIIPVWHKNRGIEDFKDMCASHVLHRIRPHRAAGNARRDHRGQHRDKVCRDAGVGRRVRRSVEEISHKPSSEGFTYACFYMVYYTQRQRRRAW